VAWLIAFGGPQSPREPTRRARQWLALLDMRDPPRWVPGNVMLFVVPRLWGRLFWTFLLDRWHQSSVIDQWSWALIQVND
jgi:hypothetical protein